MTTPENPNKENFTEVFKQRFAALEKEAREVGLNLTVICKRAGISRATPDRWKREIPKTIEILGEMERILAEHKSSLPPIAPR